MRPFSLILAVLVLCLIAVAAQAQTVYLVPAPRFAPRPAVAYVAPAPSYQMQCAGGVCRMVQVVPTVQAVQAIPSVTATQATVTTTTYEAAPVVIYHRRGVFAPRVYAVYP